MVERIAGPAGHNGVGMATTGAPARLDAGRALADGKAIDAPGGRAAGAMAPAGPSALSGLKGIIRDLAARPPVDAERLAALNLAIQSGSYRVDPDRVAEAMIASLAPRP